MALAHRLGVETDTVVDALGGGPLVSLWQAAKLQRIANGDFSAQFALSLALKDVRDAGGAGKPRISQIALSYDPDHQIAVRRAMDQFRWFTGNWTVNAELPVPASFDAASKTVREEDVSTQMPCGPDVHRHVAGIREFETAGFTHIAMVQVGGDTQTNSSPGRRRSFCLSSERRGRDNGDRFPHIWSGIWAR